MRVTYCCNTYRLQLTQTLVNNCFRVRCTVAFVPSGTPNTQVILGVFSPSIIHIVMALTKIH